MEDSDTRRLVEGVVERRIREAVDRGEFASLPGAGRPIRDLGEGYDPAWWTKRWVRRQRLETEASDLREELRSVTPRASFDEAAGRRRAAIEERLAAIERSLAGAGG
ncbi:MAG TPA: DnaJ family domain-containing protein, partial [Acidimicrobiia bacterium]|nr:DnaJ family domain-containing protein [Acidimicrobiia bacterium]